MINFNNKETKVICGIATMNSRKSSLHRVMTCLKYQTVKPDKVIIYNNDENDFNATDNGKFYYFETEESKNEEVIILSMDDDILYPKDYIERCIEYIDTYKCIITFHGRKLNGLDLDYYRGHQSFPCLRYVDYQGYIDVAGTGVTSFHTSYFKPKGIFKSEYKRMSDCVFSLEAAKEDKKIMMIAHKEGYFKDICDDVENSCHRKEYKQPLNQIKICNEIWNLKMSK